LELAIAGEDIRIRKGDAVVELRPVGASGPPSSNEHLSPREALRCLQTEGREFTALPIGDGGDLLEKLSFAECAHSVPYGIGFLLFF
jgi:hypothetical protein